MTVHIRNKHKCIDCGAVYLPYDNIPCPKCGASQDADFDFLRLGLNSIQYNIDRYGTPHPGAWLISSFADEMLSIFFKIYIAYQGKKSEMNFESLAGDMMKTLQLSDDNEYLRDHIFKLVIRIYNDLPQSGSRNFEYL